MNDKDRIALFINNIELLKEKYDPEKATSNGMYGVYKASHDVLCELETLSKKAYIP